MIIPFQVKVDPKITHPEITGMLLSTVKKHIEDNKIKTLGFPEFSDVMVNYDSLTFKATLYPRPAVKLGEYKNIPIVKKFKEIPTGDIDKAVNFLLKIRQENNEVMTEDELAKKMGYYDGSTLRSALKMEMFKEKDLENRKDAILQIKNYLLRNCRVQVQKELVEKEFKDSYAFEVQKWLNAGNTEDTIPKDGKARVRKNVEEDLKLNAILDTIAEKEDIITGINIYGLVIDFLLKEAEYK